MRRDNSRTKRKRTRMRMRGGSRGRRSMRMRRERHRRVVGVTVVGGEGGLGGRSLKERRDGGRGVLEDDGGGWGSTE